VPGRLHRGRSAADRLTGGISDEGDAVRDVATVIGRRLGLPAEAVPQENFGPFGPISAMDQPSAYTRNALGRQPTRPSLLDDLENIQP